MGSESSSLRGSQTGKKDDELNRSQLKHSTSMGSLSRSAKDEVEKKAQIIVRKLSELLRNEGKSIW